MLKPARKNRRLKSYDYSSNGYYFITVCSKERQNIFGKCVGAPLACALTNIRNQFENVDIDEFVIMPNHIHGILIIDNRAEASAAPTISQIIRSFKSKSTMEYLKYINNNNLKNSGKIWQRSFYDHIIRNDESLNKIREYIVFNPSAWDKDDNNLMHN